MTHVGVLPFGLGVGSWAVFLLDLFTLTLTLSLQGEGIFLLGVSCCFGLL